MATNTDEDFKSVDPVSISWHNIEVFSKPEKRFCFFKTGVKPVNIIKKVSGYLKPSQTLAIMGSSGAGKTTLLNVLTARNLSRFTVDGVVRINHQVADVEIITSMTAYVQQDDLFIPTLTVREHLVFQAMVRMDRKLSLRSKAARINQVMLELSLAKCADTRVGGSGSFKGISGGEMKRLSFAVELLTNPSIMFCDEPTSGLDSFMAEKLVQIIKKMALNGRTTICTIHQPSSDVFGLFDNLLLMADGRVAYMGPMSGTLPYFAKIGIKCPLNYNPADFLIKELAMIPGKEFECRNKINMICEYFLSTHPPNENLRKLSSFLVNQPKEKFKSSVLQQYKALSWRSYLIAKREPILTNIRLLQTLFISVVLGLIYLDQKYDQHGVFNMNGALFLILTNMTYQNTFAVINTFCNEVPIFIREHSNGMYKVAPYFVCKNLAEFPVFVLIPIVFVSVYYYMVGFVSEIGNFLFVMFIAILISACGIAFGYLMSCASKTSDLALALTPPILMPLQILGGFFINKRTVPSYLSWIKYISWFFYGFEQLAVNQWKNVKKINCEDLSEPAVRATTHWINQSITTVSELSSLSTVSSSVDSVGTTSVTPSKSNSFCLPNGTAIIQFLDLRTDRTLFDIGALLCMCFGCRLLAYLILLMRAKNR